MEGGVPTARLAFVFVATCFASLKTYLATQKQKLAGGNLMKRTLWRALLVVALLSNVFAVLPVAATFPAPDQATPPDDPARVATLTPTRAFLVKITMLT